MAKKAEVAGKIYQTTDYDQFKTIIGNRPVKLSGAMWRELLESIQEYGQLAPALVTADGKIIDGQHRLEACRICGKPFLYVILGGAGFESIAESNLGVSWKLPDYIRGYAMQGNENYQMFQTVMDEFLGKLTFTSIRAVAGLHSAEAAMLIKRGGLSFTDQERNRTAECIRDLIAAGYQKWVKDNPRSTRAYWEACAYCWRHPGVNTDTLIRKINENTHRIPYTTRSLEYLKVFSEIYNKGKRRDSRVYLDTDYERGLYVKWGDK